MDLTSEIPHEGTRLSLNGNVGTIRFVGRVDGTLGLWFGVEWDDPKRGKHDGVKDGKHYFTCRLPGLNSGSFIRPSASICYGYTFLRALTSKYIELPHGTTTQERFLLRSSNGTIEVEAVGLDKIRGKLANLQRLREISLDGESVAVGDPTGEILRVCPNVRGVDLSRNLLPSWDVVALITSELPFLERLALNKNRLQPFADHHVAASAFRNLMDLQLNGTMMTWQEMQEVTTSMPHLRVVEFGYNHLTTLCPNSPVSPESAIQTINLDSNKCHDWGQICQAVVTYPSLQRLILTSNHVDKISPLQDHDRPLRTLIHLSLSHNQLKSWSDVDSLSRWCPRLQSLSIAGNPIVEDSDGARHYIVAKIPSLMVLDGVVISQKERTDCELFYMSRIVRGGSLLEDRIREHPRWNELCLKHGQPDEIPKGNAHQDNLRNRMIDICVYPIADPPAAETSRVADAPSLLKHLRVLPTMSLRALRLKILKSIPRRGNVPIELWLRMGDEMLVPLDTKQDDQDLSWWGIESDSHVLYHVDMNDS